MRRVLRFHPFVFLLVCAAPFVPGCGGDKGVKVEGQIVRDGNPYAAAEGETVNLSFAGKNAKGEDAIYPATVNAGAGSFVVNGPEGKGIPPGKYKITINLSSGGSDPASLAKLEKVNAQFARINGKECDITSEPVQKITIDIGKGTVGK